MKSSHRIKTKSGFSLRSKRVGMSQGAVQVIARNSTARFSSFWLELVNMSSSGLAIRFAGKGFLPFVVNDSLSLTLDTSSRIFSRPIHLKARICRRHDEEITVDGESITLAIFGLEITHVDPLHLPIWQTGLMKFEGMDQQENFETFRRAS